MGLTAYARRLKRANCALNPFSNLYFEMETRIQNMSTPALKKLVEYSAMMTQSNCWSCTFRVTPIAKMMALEELERRDYRKRTRKTRP